MKFQIKNRWTANVQFECELTAEVAEMSYGLRLGLAVKKAYAGGADLRGAVLCGADLRDAILRDADLCDADLRDADLRGATLRDADLRDADLRGAILCDADLRGAVLSGAVLRGAVLRGIPVIPDIHKRVYEAASREGALDMKTWHSCETTHCRAGWVVTLAGDAGRAMEWCIGTSASAALIYLASDPNLERVPDFYASNEAALADMKRLANAST